jgi:predicted MPP superfamily phosphohydrolase
MSSATISLIFFVAVDIAVDFYMFRGLQGLAGKWRFLAKKWFLVAYVVACVLVISDFLIAACTRMEVGLRLDSVSAFFGILLLKTSFSFFLLIDDTRRSIKRFVQKRKNKVSPKRDSPPKPEAIPRSEFLLKAGLLAGAIPLGAFWLDMKSGLYDYHVKRHNLYLPNLPKAFDGIRLGQISDIHSGSFFDKKAVLGGVEMLMREKADLIFFTGDLVNEQSKEMRDYQDIFSKVKAPLGVFSCLGNHDFSDYMDENDLAAKKQNLAEIVATHKNMGWDLLRNENRRLKIGNEEIGILGIDNWAGLGTSRRYGKMELAVKNTDDLPVKLLLSHDPSHWRMQVLPEYPQIDMVFAGHTHGMQCGIKTKHLQWSPIEYLYSEWDGFYREGKQQIYVNVGYGFYGVPGRVGILPEITIFTLKSAAGPSLINT